MKISLFAPRDLTECLMPKYAINEAKWTLCVLAIFAALKGLRDFYSLERDWKKSSIMKKLINNLPESDVEHRIHKELEVALVAAININSSSGRAVDFYPSLGYYMKNVSCDDVDDDDVSQGSISSQDSSINSPVRGTIRHLFKSVANEQELNKYIRAIDPFVLNQNKILTGIFYFAITALCANFANQLNKCTNISKL